MGEVASRRADSGQVRSFRETAIVAALRDGTAGDLSGPTHEGLDLSGANLRGVDLRHVNLRTADLRGAYCKGVDLRGESYGLLIDTIGEVLTLPDDARETNPVNLDPRMAAFANGVYRLDGQLMVVLDVDKVLELNVTAQAA